MNRAEIIFDYGAWSVEFASKHGAGRCLHEWLVVALWKAWWRMPRSASTGAKRG